MNALCAVPANFFIKLKMNQLAFTEDKVLLITPQVGYYTYIARTRTKAQLKITSASFLLKPLQR
jgi:hypothetical protein